MTSLLDVAPMTESVSVAGNVVNVSGVSALGIAHLLAKFPELKVLITGGDVKVTADTILEAAPAAIAAIIAAGVGKPGDKDHEEAAARLPVGDQLELISVIVRLTMPDGIRPFVAKVRALMGGVVAEEVEPAASVVPGKVPATKSRSQ